MMSTTQCRAALGVAAAAANENIRMLVLTLKADQLQLQQRMGSCEELVGSCEELVGSCEERLGSYEERLGSCEERLGSCEERLGSCEERLANCEEQVGTLARMRMELEQKTEPKSARAVFEVANWDIGCGGDDLQLGEDMYPHMLNGLAKEMGAGLDKGLNMGMRVDAGLDKGLNTDMRVDAGLDKGLNTDMRVDAGLDKGLNTDMLELACMDLLCMSGSQGMLSLLDDLDDVSSPAADDVSSPAAGGVSPAAAGVSPTAAGVKRRNSVAAAFHMLRSDALYGEAATPSPLQAVMMSPCPVPSNKKQCRIAGV
jgi:hypothetical protein